MRVRFGAPLGVGNADHFEQRHGALPAGILGPDVQHIESRGRLVAYFLDVLKCRSLLLEDHRDTVAAHLDHFIFRKGKQVFAIQ